MGSAVAAKAEPSQTLLPITGSLDRITHELVEGWILDRRDLKRRLYVDIYLDKEFVGRVRADMLRKDLVGHLGSDGHHAFRFDIRGRIPDLVGHSIVAIESETDYDFGKGVRLRKSPHAALPIPKAAEEGKVAMRSLMQDYGLPKLDSPEVAALHKIADRAEFKVEKSFFAAISKDTNADMARQAFVDEMRGTGCPLYVATFNNATVTQEAAIVTAEGSIVAESCYPYVVQNMLGEFRNSFMRTDDGAIAMRSTAATRIDEEVIYLRERGEAGYFHWINSILPRLWLLEKAGINPDLKLYLYAPPSFQQDSLRFIGIPESRLLQARPGNVVFRKLHFPAPLIVGGSHWNRPREIMPFFDGLVAKAMGGKPVKPSRLIYLSRSDAPVRRLMNEKDVFAQLRKHGFEFVATAKMAFADQVRLFASAKAVISVHGAGLSNVAFMQPGTKVLEIVSPDRLWPTFRSLAVRRGLRYGCIVGDRVAPTGADQIAAGNNDFMVSAATVEEAARAIIAG